MLVLWLLVALLVLAGGAVAGVMLLAGRQRSRRARDNQVIPGTPTRAPLSWTGSHDPEARLHRRLRDSMTALRTVAALDDAASITLRAGLEQQALALDDNLVAVAALAPEHRDRQLPEITRAVAALESGVAQYASAATKPDMAALEADLAGVRADLDAVTELRRTFGQM